MKNIYTALLVLISAFGIASQTYTVTVTGAPAYSPNSLTVQVGDMVFIQASGAHPNVQVDQTTWNANGTTSLTGGWGVKNADHTFTATTVGVIYYVCQVHAGAGMKGMITVVNASGLKEYAYNSSSIQVFPNPAADKIRIQSPILSEATFTLMNALGQNVNGFRISETRNDEIEVTLPAQISNGVYFAVLSNHETRLVKRIVINR